jgi:hypothetical protein
MPPSHNSRSMNRRKFLLLGTAGVAALSCSFGYYYYSNTTPSGNNLAKPYSLLQIMEPSTISDIGKKYLGTMPAEKNRKVLTQLLQDLESPGSSVSEFIPAAIRNDFTANRLVIVNGWVLSQTEARQCALYFLTPNS